MRFIGSQFGCLVYDGLQSRGRIRRLTTRRSAGLIGSNPDSTASGIAIEVSRRRFACRSGIDHRTSCLNLIIACLIPRVVHEKRISIHGTAKRTMDKVVSSETITEQIVRVTVLRADGSSRRNRRFRDTGVPSNIHKNIVVEHHVIARLARIGAVEINASAAVVGRTLPNIGNGVIGDLPARRLPAVELNRVALVALQDHVVGDLAVKSRNARRVNALLMVAARSRARRAHIVNEIRIDDLIRAVIRLDGRAQRTGVLGADVMDLVAADVATVSRVAFNAGGVGAVRCSNHLKIQKRDVRSIDRDSRTHAGGKLQLAGPLSGALEGNVSA